MRGLSILTIMIAVNLAGVADINAKLDSSLPTSCITPRLAHSLISLENVAVSGVVPSNGAFFQRVVNFSVYDKLMSDCVLGADFLVCVGGGHGTFFWGGLIMR